MKKESLHYIDNLVLRYPALVSVKDSLVSCLDLLVTMYRKGGKLLICGNGGSFADSQHIVGELLKVFVKKRDVNPSFASKLNHPELASRLTEAVPAISLGSDEGYFTAYANDEDYVFAFAQQVYTLGKEEDMLFCISTSGNSKNCVYAAEVAKAKGMKVVALTGMKESKLSQLCDLTLFAPSSVTFEIQEYHLPIYHALCLALEEELF